MTERWTEGVDEFVWGGWPEAEINEAQEGRESCRFFGLLLHAMRLLRERKGDLATGRQLEKIGSHM